jgi:cardiolipin synthase
LKKLRFFWFERQSDVPIMAYAARHLYQDFLGDGVRIFEYKKKVLHSKTMVIDDVFSTFGSFNFDDW